MSTTSGPVQGGGQNGEQNGQDPGQGGQDRGPSVQRPGPLAGRSGGETRQRRLAVVAGAAATLLVAVAAVALASSGSGGGAADGEATADASPTLDVEQAVATVPAQVLDAVGRGQTLAEPRLVDDQPALSEGGKPLLLYLCAEYCPYCASQRWAVVVALSRFGTFTNLGLTHSASDIGYPDTPTFTFHGTTYTSQYLAFQGVEIATNERVGNDYAPLDELTDQQRQIVATMNAPPYVSPDSAGAIPFMDFGNKYVLVGSSYDVRLLQGRSAEQIATALRDPEDPIAQAVLGSANLLTTVICQLTGGQPAPVCDGAAARAYQSGA